MAVEAFSHSCTWPTAGHRLFQQVVAACSLLQGKYGLLLPPWKRFDFSCMAPSKGMRTCNASSQQEVVWIGDAKAVETVLASASLYSFRSKQQPCSFPGTMGTFSGSWSRNAFTGSLPTSLPGANRSNGRPQLRLYMVLSLLADVLL